MSLLPKIMNKKATIAVLGLGYVGVPLIQSILKAGFHVFGIDTNQVRVTQIEAGEAYLSHIDFKQLKDAVMRGQLTLATDFDKIANSDIIISCVPTPLNATRDPDLSYVRESFASALPFMQKDQLFVLESTTYPGTTEEVVKPILERSGLKSGKDFYLAYSPEREDPGNQNFDFSTIPKIVGGDGETAQSLALAFYSQIVAKTHAVSDVKTAEAVKLTENIFRAVNIALVNELKVIYQKMGIDIWEVIEAAKTKPFGYMPFYPGPGLGGHCIPVDPFYLTWKAKEFGIDTKFIELSGEINASMPIYVVDVLAQILNQKAGRALSQSNILIMGAAYKKNISDVRESPALKIITLLDLAGAKTAYHDPYVAQVENCVSVKHISADSYAAYDAVMIVTDHDDIDYQMLFDHAKLVIDTRNVSHRYKIDATKVFKV